MWLILLALFKSKNDLIKTIVKWKFRAFLLWLNIAYWMSLVLKNRAERFSLGFLLFVLPVVLFSILNILDKKYHTYNDLFVYRWC